jgi:hypothetical protein
VDNTTPQEIHGPIPAPAINTTLGDQVMHYNCIGALSLTLKSSIDVGVVVEF